MTARVVKLSAVWAMLATCAPGYTTDSTDHYHRIYFAGKTYATLPLGEHGARRDAEIFAGHVRHLARHFEITECAKRALPQAF